MIDEDEAEDAHEKFLAAGWPPELAYLASYASLKPNGPVIIRLLHGAEYTVKNVYGAAGAIKWVQCELDDDPVSDMEIMVDQIAYVRMVVPKRV